MPRKNKVLDEQIALMVKGGGHRYVTPKARTVVTEDGRKYEELAYCEHDGISVVKRTAILHKRK